MPAISHLRFRDYQLIYPIISDDPSISTVYSNQRHRRSAPQLRNDLFLNFTAFNQTFQLHLRRNEHFVAPHSYVQYRYYNVSSSSESIDKQCYFKGKIASRRGKAAVSLCDGVNGVLQLEDDDYIFEPTPHHLLSTSYSDTEASHILYRASSSSVQNQYFDTNYTIENNKSDIYYNPSRRKEAEFDENQTLPNGSYIYFNPARRKRATPRKLVKTVETLVVVDKHVYWKHGRNNITTYVLSMFNIVSQLFQESGIGYRVKIVVVGLIILESNEPGLNINNNADKTLNSFCQWQALIKKGRQKKHDHAVLLTGLDICAFSDKPCDTLGFAPIKGMCEEARSCIVTEDSGLSTAFTIAHEIGHNFGMMHDGTDNPCRSNAGTIMSPTLSSRTGLFRWSRCSKHYLDRYFNTIQASCLENRPHGLGELQFPDRLPGELFDADTQCRWQFGRNARLCIFDFGKREICQKLWCYKGGLMCETKFLPAADGTSCGNGMWCKQGNCESYGRKGPQPRDGNWSVWAEWEQCSRTCGGGVKKRNRLCSNPLPQYGGKQCQGKSDIYKLCNLQECPYGSKDFREEQCSYFNKHRFRGFMYKWMPYKRIYDGKIFNKHRFRGFMYKWMPYKRKYDGKIFNKHRFRGFMYKWMPYKRIYDEHDQCKLYCQADGFNFYYALSKQVDDGTRCNGYSDNICVQGKCKTVGCDLVVDSTARKDVCGVCMGDDSTCRKVKGRFDKQPPTNTYFPIMVLPRGARTIQIAEEALSRNYLAVRDIYGKYFLNGNWHLNSNGAYSIAGAKFIYKRSYIEPEILQSDGPLLEDVVLEILTQGKNPGVSYQYTLPKTDDRPRRYNFTWTVKLSTCSEQCAGGIQKSSAHCYRGDGEEVNPRVCDQSTRPRTGISSCHTRPCQPGWYSGPWTECTRTCGGGKQKRRVYCSQKISLTKERRVRRNRCSHLKKPARKIPCNTQECPPSWHAKGWSECTVTCGYGRKIREVTCLSHTTRGSVLLPDSMCHHQPAMDKVTRCQMPTCPSVITYQWNVASWSQCSTTCDYGTRRRELTCNRQIENNEEIQTVRPEYCQNIPPLSQKLSERCIIQECAKTKPYWYTSPLSQCSVSCGRGSQTRLVHCLDELTQELSTGCDWAKKPDSQNVCVKPECPKPDPRCTDQFKWCFLVPKHGICHHRFYGSKCCRSCHGFFTG
ncbi:A disintegrin and metalloproteinase with thrombospondin motifs 18,A disintegrin and metalloproteinase with thrombospondin motifs 16 [Mytilus coruscus]|uniref:A disintegrin and metalloproteinase with thrombospondin motifs 18,A disintegrin and metalloproteinase with thrombospondin motifs 16 n=1 Tax=Mytilus coruscus TaxID=42192 RepID=A0A6J8CQB7_MYTCO|nr:A disintegrin and metalloproteinase with thrombospondin motifs 18,A disintegrin and metalloproteinase with thrombospondin motifs 16 [Mytilus coruscus]